MDGMNITQNPNLLLLLPVLLPLATAILAMLAWDRVDVQRRLSAVGAGITLLAGAVLLYAVWTQGILAVQVGNWSAPFGITFVADLLSAIMVTLSGLMGLSVVVYSFAHIDAQREAHGYYPLLQVLLVGVNGALLTGDMFNLFVWFEVMLISSFVLIALGGTWGQLEGAIKYVTLNLMASALFLAAVGILYGVAGTLNMADLAVRLPDVAAPGLVTTLAMLFLVAFGIKSAIFPFFFWLPASYHTPPTPISAIFAGLLTKVGVYVLIRVFTLIFVQDVGYTHTVIMVIAGLTMITGVLGAVAQMDLRRLLSFHIVSQIGYMLMGLALFTPLALAGAIFFLIHNITAKANLFLISGVIRRLEGTESLKKLGGLYRGRPAFAVLFLVPALSLAGIPPLPGFWAKLTLIRAGLEIQQYAIVAAALGVSVLTLYSMTKIWAEAFWKTAPAGTAIEAAAEKDLLGPFTQRDWLISLLPIVSLVVLTVLIGLAAEPIFQLSFAAADQLMNPAGYVAAVLGK